MKLGPILLSKYLPHLFLHSSVNGHSDSLHSFAMVEHVAVNLKMLDAMDCAFFVPFGYIPRSAIAAS